MKDNDSVLNSTIVAKLHTKIVPFFDEMRKIEKEFWKEVFLKREDRRQIVSFTYYKRQTDESYVYNIKLSSVYSLSRSATTGLFSVLLKFI